MEQNVNTEGPSIIVCFLTWSLTATLPTSQMARCIQFLVAKKLISNNEPFFSATPCVNAPLLIIAWIMDGYAKSETLSFA